MRDTQVYRLWTETDNKFLIGICKGLLSGLMYIPVSFVVDWSLKVDNITIIPGTPFWVLISSFFFVELVMSYGMREKYLHQLDELRNRD